MIDSQIAKFCKIYNKNKNAVKLIAVSKKQDVAKINIAMDLGCRIFGENYVKEAYEKWASIKDQRDDVQLHLLGHLQSNKAKEAVELFDVIHTLDSKKLAKEIAKQALKLNKNPEIFIQVNIGDEEQKSGVGILDLGDLVSYCVDDLKLNVVGLMCIPPSNESGAPYFALLAKLAKENNLKQLSMGMSADYEDAIAMGATYVRIGTAIFGERG